MKTKLVLLLLPLMLSGCLKRGIVVKAGVGAPDAIDGGQHQDGNISGFAADGYTVVVKRYGESCKPEYLSGVTITCEATKPTPHIIVKATEVDGSAHFSVRGPARFWCDYMSHVYIVGNIENSDTVPNQNVLEFALPGGNQDCGGTK